MYPVHMSVHHGEGVVIEWHVKREMSLQPDRRGKLELPPRRLGLYIRTVLFNLARLVNYRL